MKKTPVIIVIVIAVLAGLLLWYVAGRKSDAKVIPPVIVYEEGTITGFEASGVPVGRSAVYRWDSVGHPQMIMQEQETTRLPFDAIQLDDGALSVIQPAAGRVPGAGPNGTIEIRYDLTGRKIQEIVHQEDEPLAARVVVSPDKRYTVSVPHACRSGAETDSCIPVLSVSMNDAASGVKRVLEPEDLHEIPEWYRGSVLGFSSDSRTVFLFFSAPGERSDGFLVRVELATGKAETTLKGNVSPERPEDNVYYSQLEGSHDGRSFFLVKSGEDAGSFSLLRFYFDTETVEEVTSLATFPWWPNILAPDDARIVLQNEPGSGFSIFHLREKTTTAVVQEGDFQAWAPDGRSVVYLIWETDDYFGPQRLMVRNLTTGGETTIYRQGIHSSGEKKDAKIGDTIYRFVGVVR